MHILKHEFKLACDVQWSYSATSHGKGVVDGIGGRAKSLVRQAVMSKNNKAIVQCAKDFVNVAQQKMEHTSVILVEYDEMNSNSKSVGSCTRSPRNKKGSSDPVELWNNVMKNHLER